MLQNIFVFLSWDNQCDNLCPRIAGKMGFFAQIKIFRETQYTEIYHMKKQSSL